MQSQRQFVVHYRQMRTRIFSYFLQRLSGDAQTAEDLASNVFVKAFRKFDTYNDDFAFSTWVYTIARNELTDYLRKSTQHTRVDIENAEDIEDEDEAFYAVLDTNIDVERVRTCLSSLPKNQAEAVYRRYFLCEEIADVANALAKSEQATRQLLSRGCRALRQLLSEQT